MSGLLILGIIVIVVGLYLTQTNKVERFRPAKQKGKQNDL